jgi:cytochrome c oxidase cbb3-type subunit III
MQKDREPGTPPSSERRDVVREHDFDGIQEFDNQLPRWWVGTFVLTVLFGLWVWTTRHTFRSDPSLREHYEADLAELKALQEAKAGTVTDEQVLAAYRDPAELAAGKQVFMANCMACHRSDAGGQIGPNLTDDHWIHGGRPGQIAAVIVNGVPDKGMVTWKGVLSSAQIKQVAAYVVSVHGSHPKDPKAPQGKAEAWTLR